MKKDDVKKFASTKHKGLPEKKKIEEDREIKKVIKQLRKSVKAHDKQADTLEKKIEEQISFPQMQERIRNAKEKRREQQKKSEKLYMDTKKKGVKFYDKKGTGRLKDGKKVYD